MATITYRVCDFCDKKSTIAFAWSTVTYGGSRLNSMLSEVASSGPRDVCHRCFEELVKVVNGFIDIRKKHERSISGL
jgi:hypothetical protein